MHPLDINNESAQHPLDRPGGFALTRADHHVLASGLRRPFTSVAEASEALHNQQSDVVVGMLAFDPAQAPALYQPQQFTIKTGRWSPSIPTPLPPIRLISEDPLPEEHKHRVQNFIDRITSSDLEKIVAARSITFETIGEQIILPSVLLSTLVHRDSQGNGFSSDLSVAGARFSGRYLVGSSPELLVQKTGNKVTCWPFAGSAPRNDNPRLDQASAQALMSSDKDLAEHAFVTRWLSTQLSNLCTDIRVPPAPSLASTPQVWHLATKIQATTSSAISALDLAAVLHPTPAVAGTPTSQAISTINQIEGNRGFYGGAVGWTQANGDGEWMVAIRCAELEKTGARGKAYAGGGIVATSDPQTELDETSTKLKTLLSAFSTIL
ncbi:MAG: isochorismate synthase [Mycobacteriaceae bacterium]